MRRVPAELLLVGAMLLWSFNYTAMRFGITHGFAPLVYAPLRWLLAGFALGALAWGRRRRVRVRGRDLAVLTLVSCIGIVANQVALLYALDLAPAATVALVFGMLPVLISLMSQLGGVEQLRARHWLATGASFVGVALVSLGTGGHLTGDLGGVLLALLTVCSFSVYSVVIVPLMRRYSPLDVAAVTTVIGAVLLAILAAPFLASQDWSRPGVLAWGALAYSAVPSIVLGNMLWFTAVDRVGPGRASIFTNLQPFVAAVFALLVLSERLGPLQIAGGFVIAVGLGFGRRSRVGAPASE